MYLCLILLLIFYNFIFLIFILINNFFKFLFLIIFILNFIIYLLFFYFKFLKILFKFNFYIYFLNFYNIFVYLYNFIYIFFYLIFFSYLFFKIFLNINFYNLSINNFFFKYNYQIQFKKDFDLILILNKLFEFLDENNLDEFDQDSEIEINEEDFGKNIFLKLNKLSEGFDYDFLQIYKIDTKKNIKDKKIKFEEDLIFFKFLEKNIKYKKFNDLIFDEFDYDTEFEGEDYESTFDDDDDYYNYLFDENDDLNDLYLEYDNETIDTIWEEDFEQLQLEDFSNYFEFLEKEPILFETITSLFNIKNSKNNIIEDFYNNNNKFQYLTDYDLISPLIFDSSFFIFFSEDYELAQYNLNLESFYLTTLPINSEQLEDSKDDLMYRYDNKLKIIDKQNYLLENYFNFINYENDEDITDEIEYEDGDISYNFFDFNISGEEIYYFKVIDDKIKFLKEEFEISFFYSFQFEDKFFDWEYELPILEPDFIEYHKYIFSKKFYKNDEYIEDSSLELSFFGLSKKYNNSFFGLKNFLKLDNLNNYYYSEFLIDKDAFFSYRIFLLENFLNFKFLFFKRFFFDYTFFEKILKIKKNIFFNFFISNLQYFLNFINYFFKIKVLFRFKNNFIFKLFNFLFLYNWVFFQLDANFKFFFNLYFLDNNFLFFFFLAEFDSNFFLDRFYNSFFLNFNQNIYYSNKKNELYTKFKYYCQYIKWLKYYDNSNAEISRNFGGFKNFLIYKNYKKTYNKNINNNMNNNYFKKYLNLNIYFFKNFDKYRLFMKYINKLSFIFYENDYDFINYNKFNVLLNLKHNKLKILNKLLLISNFNLKNLKKYKDNIEYKDILYNFYNFYYFKLNIVIIIFFFLLYFLFKNYLKYFILFEYFFIIFIIVIIIMILNLNFFEYFSYFKFKYLLSISIIFLIFFDLYFLKIYYNYLKKFDYYILDSLLNLNVKYKFNFYANNNFNLKNIYYIYFNGEYNFWHYFGYEKFINTKYYYLNNNFKFKNLLIFNDKFLMSRTGVSGLIFKDLNLYLLENYFKFIDFQKSYFLFDKIFEKTFDNINNYFYNLGLQFFLQEYNYINLQLFAQLFDKELLFFRKKIEDFEKIYAFTDSYIFSQDNLMEQFFFKNLKYDIPLSLRFSNDFFFFNYYLLDFTFFNFFFRNFSDSFFFKILGFYNLFNFNFFYNFNFYFYQIINTITFDFFSYFFDYFIDNFYFYFYNLFNYCLNFYCFIYNIRFLNIQNFFFINYVNIDYNILDTFTLWYFYLKYFLFYDIFMYRKILHKDLRYIDSGVFFSDFDKIEGLNFSELYLQYRLLPDYTRFSDVFGLVLQEGEEYNDFEKRINNIAEWTLEYLNFNITYFKIEKDFFFNYLNFHDFFLFFNYIADSEIFKDTSAYFYLTQRGIDKNLIIDNYIEDILEANNDDFFLNLFNQIFNINNLSMFNYNKNIYYCFDFFTSNFSDYNLLFDYKFLNNIFFIWVIFFNYFIYYIFNYFFTILNIYFFFQLNFYSFFEFFFNINPIVNLVFNIFFFFMIIIFKFSYYIFKFFILSYYYYIIYFFDFFLFFYLNFGEFWYEFGIFDIINEIYYSDIFLYKFFIDYIISIKLFFFKFFQEIIPFGNNEIDIFFKDFYYFQEYLVNKYLLSTNLYDLKLYRSLPLDLRIIDNDYGFLNDQFFFGFTDIIYNFFF